MIGGGGIPVRKNGFAYDEDKTDFVKLALERLGSQKALDEGKNI